MKKGFYFALFVFFLWGCSGDHDELIDKRDLLAKKKKELRQLQQEIRELEAVLEPNRLQQDLALVKTMQLERSTFRHFVELQGTVQSDDLIAVSTETGGRLVELKVREGQRVKRGQLLARFDLTELEKQLAELETSLELARDLYERQKRLWEQEIGSEVQYLQAKNQVERLENMRSTLKVRLAKANVYAPVSGQVERVLLKAGEVAGPGMPVLQLLNNAKVKVVAEVPENYLTVVKKRKAVEIEFPVLGIKRQARIDAIGQLINPSNRTFEVESYLNNSSGVLKPNLLAVIRFADQVLEDVLVVPVDLVQTEVGGKEFVFVLEKEGDEMYARKVFVKTSLRQGGKVVVVDGLQEGQQLVTEGAYKLTDGQAVRVL